MASSINCRSAALTALPAGVVPATGVLAEVPLPAAVAVARPPTGCSRVGVSVGAPLTASGVSVASTATAVAVGGTVVGLGGRAVFVAGSAVFVAAGGTG